MRVIVGDITERFRGSRVLPVRLVQLPLYRKLHILIHSSCSFHWSECWWCDLEAHCPTFWILVLVTKLLIVRNVRISHSVYNEKWKIRNSQSTSYAVEFDDTEVAPSTVTEIVNNISLFLRYVHCTLSTVHCTKSRKYSTTSLDLFVTYLSRFNPPSFYTPLYVRNFGIGILGPDVGISILCIRHPTPYTPLLPVPPYTVW